MTNTHTCLFRGTPLVETTREEHTIQRSMCGRVRSRIVTCDEFNNSSSKLDDELKPAYAPLIATLGPLLPTEFATGSIPVQVDGEAPGLEIDARGTLGRRKPAVLDRDDQKRPTAIVAPTEAAVMNIMKQAHGDAIDADVEHAPATTATTAKMTIVAVTKKLEVAVLKGALLTFDHVLEASQHRFTRTEYAAKAIELVRSTVDSGTANSDLCFELSLGLQYDQVGLFEQIRGRADFPRSQFEHVLIASGNPATGTLDMVWSVFGFDPFGFRLSEKFEGDPFSCVVVNGVLKGTSASAAIILPQSHALCGPTNRRAVFQLQRDEDRELVQQKAASRLSERRSNARSEALRLVERSCDEFIIENMSREVKYAESGRVLASDAVKTRVRRMFGAAATNPDFGARLDAALKECVTQLAPELVKEEIRSEAGDGVTWNPWLDLYRSVLQKMEGEFGVIGLHEHIGSRIESKALPGES